MPSEDKVKERKEQDLLRRQEIQTRFLRARDALRELRRAMNRRAPVARQLIELSEAVQELTKEE
jgi:hypothetical protein